MELQRQIGERCLELLFGLLFVTPQEQPDEELLQVVAVTLHLQKDFLCNPTAVNLPIYYNLFS